MLAEIGGPAYVSEVYTSSPNPAHAEFYATHVFEKWRHRQMVRTLGGMPLIGSPVRLDGARADSDLPPPALGEHTREVLTSLGLEPQEIERLKSSGATG